MSRNKDEALPAFRFSKDPVEKRKQMQRFAMATALELPRVSGDPETVAEEISRRVIARSLGYVYVGSYVRHNHRARKA